MKQWSTERLMTVKEAAERLSVSVRTIYRMIAEGQLPKPRKVRGCSRLPESALDRFLRGVS